MNILILTGKFGMGHWSASQSLRQQLLRAFPGAEGEVLDFVAEAMPNASEAMYKCFNLLVTSGSGLFNLYYKLTQDLPADARPLFETLFLDKLEELVAARRPDAVIATHPLCARMVSRWKGETGSALPLITCVTDLSSHSEWIHKYTDCYLVGSNDIRSRLAAKGVDRDIICVTGIPVRCEFKRPVRRRPGRERNLLIMGGGLGLLLLFGAVVNGALTAGMLCLMFLPNAARRLTGGVLSLLVRVRLVRRPEEAREKLEKQMEEYRRGADCVRRNPALVPALLGLTFCQLTALFSVPLVVYHAFGLTGSGALDIIGTQALVTLAVASLPLPGAVGASEGGFVAAMRLFFGAGLVTPAVLVSRGISFYSFLLLSGCVTLLVHLRTRNRQPVAVSPRLPKTARGTVVT